ncbi:hypothetical protein AMBR_BLFENHAL_01963 [Lacticaseibacillus rhamnosus]|nr:hypothetical protein AMBR_BLFENHAL_01963 [Lacticaseibacillus rhamnosus]
MALSVMARFWPLRLRSLHADFCAGERVMGIKQDKAALNVMARVWPLRLRSLHADFCAGERVMGVG